MAVARRTGSASMTSSTVTGSPVSLACAGRQLPGDIEQGPTVHDRDRPTKA
jgi:hypothetical protein